MLGVLLLLIFSVIIAYSIAYAYQLFRVRDIRVAGWEGSAGLSGLEYAYDQNLLLLPSEQVRDHLLLRNPRAKQIFITKHYPSSLAIDVSTRKTFAYLNAGSSVFELDDESYVIGKSSIDTTRSSEVSDGTNTKNPYVQLYFYQALPRSAYQLGQRIDLSQIRMAVELSSHLSDIGYRAKRIDIESSDVIRCKLEDLTVLFSASRDRLVQQYELRELLAEFKKQNKTVRVVDLRFDKPVVTF